MIKLETTRLQLHQMMLQDSPFLLKILNTPGWLKYIGDRNVRTIEDAKDYYRNKIAKSWDEEGLGFFTLKEKKTGLSIGTAGLVNRDGIDGVDIGFALLPDYEGRGFAYEACLKIIQFAREEIGLQEIFAITLPENIRSIRLLERLGLQFVGMVTLPR